MDIQPTKLLESSRIEKLAAVFLVATSVFVAFLAVGSIRDAFAPRPPAGNVISVSGMGKVTAIPDIAQVSFTVSEDADTASKAQEGAAEEVNAALESLKNELGIEEKDIKTSYYNVSPRYSNPQPCYSGICPSYEQTIIGYTASQTVEVKVRDTGNVGEVLTALGEAGASNIYGPNFTVDDPEALRQEAREMAIKDAREKAKALAKALGVSITRVSGFWEESPYYPYAENRAYGMGGDAMVKAVPEVPVGENEIAVTVNVSFEIR